MIRVLNFAHPLTDTMLRRITELVGDEVEVDAIAVHADRARPLADVARSLADAAGLTAEDWQRVPLVLNPPGLAPLAAALLAEVHGRCGYFPALVNIRPVDDASPPRFEVAEIVHLQAIRDDARHRRFETDA